MNAEPRARGLAWAALLSPVAFLLLALAAFAPSCRDGFCPGFLMQALVSILLLGALVTVAFEVLRRRFPFLGRAGLAAWCVALAGACTVFAASQFYEGDQNSAIAGVNLGLVLAVCAAMLVVRRRDRSRSLDGERNERL